MMINVAINGFGRIGRSFLRVALEGDNAKSINIVAINDLGNIDQLAHLLKYDSTLGRLRHDLTVDNDKLIIDGKSIQVTAERNIADLPWAKLDVDVVVESTGVFTDAEKARTHLEVGAKKVVISAPAKGEDLTIVYGVNDSKYIPDQHNIVSNASCTTNCLAPVIKAVHDKIGVKSGIMTTIHAFTQDQNLQDGPHKDLRRARAASVNIVPTSTGAAKAIGLVLPELAGKLDGYSVRVPVITGSLVDCVVEVARDTTVEEINAVLKSAADNELKEVLSYTEDSIVSSDIITNSASAIFDAQLTKVQEKRQVKLVAWYDNEWGFSNRLLDTVKLVGQ